MKKLIIGLLFLSLFLGVTYAYTQNELDAAKFLVARGIIKEQTNDTLYELDSSIKRGEVMKIIGKLSGLNIEEKCDGTFSDVDKNGWACKYIEFAYRENMIAKNATFRPNDLITKTESIKLLLKVKGVDKIQVTDNWQEDYMVTAYEHKFIDQKYSDYNTNAMRGWIFAIAARIVDKEELKTGVRKLISGEVKITDDNEAGLHNEGDDEIYTEAEDGTLTGDDKYSRLGKSSRGEEAYIGDGGSTVTYTVYSKDGGYHDLYARLTDDGEHGDGTRSASIKVNTQSLAYEHISEDTKGWKWFWLGEVYLNAGNNTVSFTKNQTTSGAFIMDAFKLIPVDSTHNPPEDEDDIHNGDTGDTDGGDTGDTGGENDVDPEVGSEEWKKKYPTCTDSFREEIKDAREYHANMDMGEASEYVPESTVYHEACSSQDCRDTARQEYIVDEIHGDKCYIGSECHKDFKRALIKCAEASMKCKEKVFCGF